MMWKTLARRAAIRAMHLVHLAARPMTLGVRALVFDEAGRVLLVRHSYVPGWHFPGGGVEPGETALQALERELKEEAGVEWGAEPHLASVHFNRRASRRDHVLLYVVRDIRRLQPPAPNLEIRESRFFPTDRLPEGTSAATRARLREALESEPVSPTW